MLEAVSSLCPGNPNNTIVVLISDIKGTKNSLKEILVERLKDRQIHCSTFEILVQQLEAKLQQTNQAIVVKLEADFPIRA